MIREFEKRGLELRMDDGVNVEISGRLYFVRCSLLGLLGERIIACIDFATPSATLPVKKFVESYARVRKARYAVVVSGSGEEIWIYDTIERKEVGIDDLDLRESEVKVLDRDIMIAAAYYNLIHCPCGAGDEGNRFCRLSPQW